MNLVDSVNILFQTQNIFLVSVIDGKTFKPSTNLIRISIVNILAVIGFYGWMFSTKQDVGDPKEDTLKEVPNLVMIGCQFLIWVTTIFYRKEESTFFLELVNIDKLLQRYGSLQQIYSEFYMASKWIIIPVTVELSVGIAAIYLFNIPINLLNSAALFWYIFVRASLFLYSSAFYLCIKLLRDRFQLVKEFAPECYKMEEYENLDVAHKSLIKLMEELNSSMGMKLGFVLITNSISAVIDSYVVFVELIEPTDSKKMYYQIFATILPCTTMLFMHFLSGEWITTAVKDSLHALTNVPIHTEDAVAVKRKLHLKMKAISFGISAGKVVPLNLGVLFAGFNILATYFVILLQFRTLTTQ